MKHIYFSFLFIFSVNVTNAQWANGQDAEFVVGQSSFTTATSGATANNFNAPKGIAIDVAHGKMYVADFANYRVLRFNYPITGNNPSADLVFGQSDMISGMVGHDASSFYLPTAVAVYNGDLWVADRTNNRILKFANAYAISSNKPSADVVLGQQNFTSNDFGVTQNTMTWPYGLGFDELGNLWVADTDNNRVLLFLNASSLTSGANADKVFGQSTYTTRSTVQLNGPNGLTATSTVLYVADTHNNRILRYDFPLAKMNGSSADKLYGQADYDSYLANRGGNVSDSSFATPVNLALDAHGLLYVTEYANSRLLTFDTSKTKASNVLGQSSFSTGNSGCTINQLNTPYGLAIDNTNSKMLVVDGSNNRILTFSAATPLPVELTSFIAIAKPLSVELNWQTATELNSYGFEVEKIVGSLQSAIDGQSPNMLVKIGFVQGNGNSNSPKDYSFVDTNPNSGKSYYRLKMIDIDGSFEYSEVIEVSFKLMLSTFELFQNYPNPFNPETVISYQLPENSFVTLKVFDVLGKEVVTLVNDVKEAGQYKIKFDASKIASGVYFYNLRTGSFYSTKKLIVLE